MSLIKGYPEGADITILNTSYHYPHRNEDTGKYDPDFINIVYKDNINGTKDHQIIYKPSYLFYMANDDLPLTHNRYYVSKDRVHPVECEFSQLEKTIAEMTGNEEFFYENIKLGNRRANKQLHRLPQIFGSDSNIEDHYRYRFSVDYKNEVGSITKAYFDIEVDTINMKGDFPEMGECPINAVSYIDDKTHSINVFLLRNEENKQIDEFESNFKSQENANALFRELQQFIIDNVHGEDNAKKYDLLDLKFNFMFFDDEIQLLITLFKIINHNSPDFLLAWNMAFDIPYIIERCRALGIDPALVMSDQSYEEKYASYFIDELHKNEYELRGDYYDIACNTVYMDQLVQFASLRKGSSAFPNYKLDTAADIITKGNVRKLDYSHITNNITMLPYLDYKTFVFYNIMDTVSQKCIESVNEDIDKVYLNATMNNTRYCKCHRQTIYLANYARKYFYNMGYILGNNNSSGISTQYVGALVGDPTHNSDYAKLKEGDQTYNIIDNSDDFDFKALYPSETRENNMAPDTLIGKITIDNPVNKYENPYHQDMYDRGSQWMEDLTTGNALEFGRRWLGFADFKTLLLDIQQYFMTHAISGNRPTTIYNEYGMIKPFITREDAPQDMRYKPFAYLEEGELIKPFQYFDSSKIEYIKDQLHKIE